MALYSALVAYMMLTAALLRRLDRPDPVSLALVLASLGVALAGSCWRRPVRTGAVARLLLPLALGCLLAREVWWLLVEPPSIYRQYAAADPQLRLFHLGVVLLGLLAASYAWTGMPLGRWRFPGILAVYALLGGWLLLTATTKPRIDVWHLQQGACTELLRGRNPYAADYPNVYGPGDTRYIGPEMLTKDGRVQSFPYPPLSLVLAVPGYLLGDVRWSLLMAVLGTAALMVATGRRLGLPAGHPAELAAVALLCHPRGLLVLEASWTEPFVALGLAATIWAMAGTRGRVTAGALAAGLAMKQYVFLCLPALCCGMVSRRCHNRGRLGWRQVAAAVVLAGLTALPFLLWDPRALWHGLVDFHVYSPPRNDCVSVVAAVNVATGNWLDPRLGFVAAAVVAAVVLRYGVPGLANATMGSAAIFLAFFAFNKAAHLNYYWLAAVLLALAVVIAAANAEGSGVRGQRMGIADP
jgi:hypothetical protein